MTAPTTVLTHGLLVSGQVPVAHLPKYPTANPAPPPMTLPSANLIIDPPSGKITSIPQARPAR